jgi:hypothetical protein
MRLKAQFPKPDSQRDNSRGHSLGMETIKHFSFLLYEALLDGLRCV